MRYELTSHEWTAIEPMLPNKPRGVARVNDRRVLNGTFWCFGPGRPGGTYRRASRTARTPAGAHGSACRG